MQPEEVEGAMAKHLSAGSPTPSASPHMTCDERREKYKVASGKGCPAGSATLPLPGDGEHPAPGPGPAEDHRKDGQPAVEAVPEEWWDQGNDECDESAEGAGDAWPEGEGEEWPEGEGEEWLENYEEPVTCFALVMF